MKERFGVACTVALVLLGTAASSALACPSYSNTVSVEDVPSNGTVLIDIACDTGDACLLEDVPADLPVFDRDTGEEIAGALVSVDASTPSVGVRVAWRPKQPLVAGHFYEIGWSPDVREPLGTVDLEFQALAAATWNIDAIGALATLEFQASDKHEPVELIVRVDYDSVHVNYQYLVRAALWSSGEKPPPLAPQYSRSASRSFKRAESYCYRFEVKSLINGAVKLHEACMSVAPR